MFNAFLHGKRRDLNADAYMKWPYDMSDPIPNAVCKQAEFKKGFYMHSQNDNSLFIGRQILHEKQWFIKQSVHA